MKKTILSRLISRAVQRNIIGTSVLCLTIPMAIAADSATEESSGIETLTIQGTALSRYEFYEAESATGFKADISEVPRTVQVIPE